jgi:hypothetical protein
MDLSDRAEIAWAGGFWEGEGTITCRRRDGAFSLSACQKEREPLEHLQRIFGGTIYRHSSRDIFDWQLNKFEHVQATIAAMWPWLSRRRKKQITGAVTKRRTIRHERGLK